MFNMENFNEGRVVYQPKVCHDAKRSSNIINNYEDCDAQVECNSEENRGLAKMFSKVIRQLDKRSRKDIPSNVKNIQLKGKDGER